MTCGISPAAVWAAGMDWLVHLLNAPGKRLALGEMAIRDAARVPVTDERKRPELILWRRDGENTRSDGQMSYRTILVDLSGDPPMEPRLELAKALALRFQATVIGVHVMPQPLVPAGLRDDAALIGPELIEAHWAINRSMKERMRKLFQDVLGPEPNVLWSDASGDRGRLLAVAARTADLVVTGKGDHGTIDAPSVVEHLIMAAGVPVLMLPPAPVLELGRTILVGWNASCEATRAVHDALPLLASADLVMLSAVGSRATAGLDKARLMLERHGVVVQTLRAAGSDEAAGAVLLAQAAAYGADLLVIGSYGRSRMRELLFGGVTRDLLREAAVPVLFGS